MNTPEARAAYVVSQSVAAMIAAMGMAAENKQREHRGESLAYSDKSFFDLIEEFGLGHNNVIAILNGLDAEPIKL